MSLKKRLIATAAVIVMAAGALYGSTMEISGVEEEGSRLSWFSRKETIYCWYTDEALSYYLNGAAVSFGEREGVRVIPVLVSDSEYLEAVNKASLEENQTPDVYLLSNDALEKAYLAGLASEIQDEGNICNSEHFPKAALSAVEYQGKYIAYPLFYETSALVYNETYLEEWAKQQALRELANEEEEETAEGSEEAAAVDETLLAGKIREYLLNAIPATVEDIQNIANIDNIKFALQRSFAKHINNDMTFLENYLEIANTQLNPMTFPNLPQKIDEFYINADILGKIDFKNSYFDDIKSWISSSGKIDIKKLILNWKPLVLVSKGTLNIDENFSSDLKLLSTSNGMLETLDIAENAGLFDKKGVFVAKIILGNKATPSSENDGTYTIISPINWSKQGLTLESVPLISYQQTENKNSQN